MQKELMITSLLALMILAPGLDAAPITSEIADLPITSRKGDKKPKDPWTSGSDTHDETLYINGEGTSVPVISIGSLHKAISSPHYMDKILAATNGQGQILNMASVKIDSDGPANLIAQTNSLDSEQNIGSVMDKPELEEQVETEKSSFYKLLKLIPVADNSNKQSQPLVTKSTKINLASSTSDRQEKILHMLSALEEFHRTLNGTLKSRLTIRTRGNSNSRTSGKKTKMNTEGSLKSTTMSTVVSKVASPRNSTDQVDPKLQNGKGLKKSLSSTPKKTNKRVCFWKYCSQN